ncbi:Crp/Fnr family transcriptional regulator [Chitinophaga tropicalis]|uniref:Cyclic nucleotide-binding domain-containing protein n=1 Tax=Chitinophaga tropicalis TaxID=2683588 RepID=A0A7K1U8D0_9BACT|nr:Crp/Fnr family transcriptional regulator [Chitinophaga tropicalis]MVT10548.1 cyclic nucleotide-binding domain-containing protein [Chitinophaga tropicalis]
MYELILSNFAKHISLTPAETEYVKTLLEHRVVKKNTVILKSGDICRNFYFVTKGCLRMLNVDDKGREHIVSFYPENWWAVELSSFYSHSPAFYSIDALEDTELFYFTQDSVDILYEEIPKFERFFRIFLQNAVVMYQRRMTAMLSQPAEDRYALFQKRYPGLEQRIAQKHIAAHLGITPVFLSMLRKRL